MRRLLSVVPDVHDRATFYTDNLESGIAGWTIDNKGPDRVTGTADDGLWHLTTRRGSDPGHSATHSFYYGKEASGKYDTGTRSAGAIMSAPITLPRIAANERLNLTFKYFIDTPVSNLTDSLIYGTFTAGVFGVVSADTSEPFGSNVVVHPGLVNPSGGFLSAAADVTKYAGQTIRLRASMDTNKAPENREGFYVDDVAVTRTRNTIWVSDTDAIYELDADTGAQLRSVPYPTGETATGYGGGISGLAFDGTYLYYTTPHYGSLFGIPIENAGKISVIDPANGKVVREIAPFTGGGVISALAVDPASNSLYGFGYQLSGYTDRFFHINLATGQYLATPFTGVGMIALGADFDPASGHLFAVFDDGNANSNKSVIAEIIPDDVFPKIVRKFDGPSNWEGGLAITNGRLFVSEVALDTIYELDMVTGKPLRNFAPPKGNPSGMAGANVIFPANNNLPAYASDRLSSPYLTEDLSITPGDVDWLRVSVQANSKLRVKAVLAGSGTIDNSTRLTVEVWGDPLKDAAPLAIATLDTATRTLTVPAVSVTTARPLYIRVKGATTSSANNYTLTHYMDDGFEPNNTAASATNLGRTPGTTLSGLSITSADHDWFTLQNYNANGSIYATLTLGDPDGDFAVDAGEVISADLLIDTNNNGLPDTVIETAARQGNRLSFDEHSAGANQRFWLHVTGGSAALYSMTLQVNDRYDLGQITSGQLFRGGSPVNVSADTAMHQAEMQIAVNPTNPAHLVIAVNSIYADADFSNRAFVDTYRTFNGGVTWERLRLKSRPIGLGDQLDPPGDPVVAFDRFGNLYVAYHYHNSTGAYGMAYGVLARSTDDGATYTYTEFGKAGVNFDINRIQIVLGPDAQNPAQENIYLAGCGGPPGVAGTTTFLWASPAANAAGVLPLNLSVRREVSDPAQYTDEKQFPSIAVGLNGEIYVSWWDNIFGTTQGSIRFDVDPDGMGPADFGTDQIVTTTAIDFPTYTPWQPERGIGTVPWMVIDRSGGAYNGRVYIGYIDIGSRGSNYDGTTLQLKVTRTDDPSNPAGATWSTPTSIGYISDEHASLGNIAVDPVTGEVCAIYYASSWYFSDPTFDNVTLRAFSSSDGGDNFTPRLTAPQPSDQSGRNKPSVDFLLYNGVASYGGVLYAAWADNSTNLADLEVFFDRATPTVPPPPTDLTGLPGTLPDGSISNFTLSNLTAPVGDLDVYRFITNIPEGKITLDLTLADLNANGKLDPEEKLYVSLANAYSEEFYNLVDNFPGYFIEESSIFTTAPDAAGNFHLLISGHAHGGFGRQQYDLTVLSGPDQYRLPGPDNPPTANAYSFNINIPTPIVVYGDLEAGDADSIVLVRNAKDANKLDVFLNDPNRQKPYQQFDLRSVQDIIINGNPVARNLLADTVTLDFSNGPFAAPGATARPRIFIYDGGYTADFRPITNTLYLRGPSINSALTWDIQGGYGSSFEDLTFPTLGSLTQRITFLNLPGTQVIDQTAGALTMNVIDRPTYDDYGGSPTHSYLLDLNLKTAPTAGYLRLSAVPWYASFYYDANGNTVPYRQDWWSTVRYDLNAKSAVTLSGADNPSAGYVLPSAVIYNIAPPSVPATFKTLKLVGGAKAIDAVAATGLSATTRLDTAAGVLHGAMGAGGILPITLQQIRSVNLSAGAAKSLQIDNAAVYSARPSISSVAAGTITADTYAVSYKGFGATSTITLKGKANSSLTVNGTRFDDVVTVGLTGTVQIAGRLSLLTSGITKLTLSDGATAAAAQTGSDTWKVPLDPACVFTSIAVLATPGALGSAQLFLTGPSAGSTINLTAGDATIGSRSVRFSGIQLVTFTGGTGANTLVVKGKTGAKEAFTITGSQTAKSGRIAIAGPTSLNFNFINVLNVSLTADSADGDTLAIQGTAAADLIQIGLAASGTASDPILRLKSASGAALLNVLNYTGIGQMRLLSLAGNDTITVNAASAPARNILVDGGAGTDLLSVLYSGTPTVIRATGSIDLKYGLLHHFIQYLAVESAVATQK